jgi:hypothetical protein
MEAQVNSDGLARIDCGIRVAEVGDADGVGTVVPAAVESTAEVATGLEALERALRTPDYRVGGYPAVVVVDPSATDHVGILTPDDLPDLYDLLGR